MKVTLKQLEAKCRQINPYMRKTRYGVAVCRSGEDIAVQFVSRKTGFPPKTEFVGSAREADAYLDGLVTGVAMLKVGEDEDDGSCF
jgi:hypothetical protein